MSATLIVSLTVAFVAICGSITAAVITRDKKGNHNNNPGFCNNEEKQKHINRILFFKKSLIIFFFSQNSNTNQIAILTDNNTSQNSNTGPWLFALRLFASPACLPWACRLKGRAGMSCPVP